MNWCLKRCWWWVVLLLIVDVVLFVVWLMTKPTHQSTVIPSHSGDVPPPGTYTADTNIFGNRIQVTMNLTQSSPTSGTFDFHLTNPKIDCGFDNSFSSTGPLQPLQFILGQCAVQQLDKYGVVIQSISYSNATQILGAKLMWANIFPLSFSLTRVSPSPSPGSVRVESNSRFNSVKTPPENRMACGAMNPSPTCGTQKCSGYVPSSSTESLAHLQSSTNCVPDVRTYPYDCGYSRFIEKQPGPGFAGTPFEPTTVWMQPYADQVRMAVSAEVRSGYPRSSYVPLAAKTSLPPQFVLCNQ